MRLNEVEINNPTMSPILNMNRDNHVVKYMKIQLKGYKFLEENYSVSKVSYRRWMFEQMNLKPKTAVLDYGCWSGLLWAENKDRISNDIAYSLIDQAQINIRMTSQALADISEPFNISLMSFGELSFQENTFDVVCSEAGFMCMKEDTQNLAFNEAHRVLKDDGTFYCLFRDTATVKDFNVILKEFDPKLSLTMFLENSIDSAEAFIKKASPLYKDISFTIKNEQFVVTDAKFFVNLLVNMDYCDSFLQHVVKKHKLKAFEDYITQLIKTRGGITLNRNYYLAACKNKKNT